MGRPVLGCPGFMIGVTCGRGRRFETFVGLYIKNGMKAGAAKRKCEAFSVTID